MTGSASQKYTDRDVRENELEMRHFVEAYLERYHGEFEFLIDCKMRLAEGYMLTVGMVRGVLNCMRIDPRVKGLPAPLPPLEDDDAEVIPMRPYRRREHPDMVPPPRDTRPWGIHATATVRGKYVVSKSLSMLHRIDTERAPNVEWVRMDTGRKFNRLRVPVDCHMPSWLSYQTLSPLWVLTFTNKQKAMSALKKCNPEVTLCVRCFPEADG